LLLENRHEAAEEGFAPFAEKMAWKIWKIAMLRRGWMNLANGNIKGKVINSIGKAWTRHRSDLVFPKKSFNQQWKDKKGRS